MIGTLAEVQQTEQQFLFHGQRMCEQSIMPPHDILACLFQHPHIFHPIVTGEPGRVEAYWMQNQDLLESLEMPDLDPWVELFLSWLRVRLSLVLS